LLVALLLSSDFLLWLSSLSQKLRYRNGFFTELLLVQFEIKLKKRSHWLKIKVVFVWVSVSTQTTKTKTATYQNDCRSVVSILRC